MTRSATSFEYVTSFYLLFYLTWCVISFDTLNGPWANRVGSLFEDQLNGLAHVKLNFSLNPYLGIKYFDLNLGMILLNL